MNLTFQTNKTDLTSSAGGTFKGYNFRLMQKKKLPGHKLVSENCGHPIMMPVTDITKQRDRFLRSWQVHKTSFDDDDDDVDAERKSGLRN